MKTYIVPITVTESGAVIVQAEPKDQARKLARGEYNNEKTKWIGGEVQIIPILNRMCNNYFCNNKNYGAYFKMQLRCCVIRIGIRYAYEYNDEFAIKFELR